MENPESRKGVRLRLWWLVFIGLAVFTTAEVLVSLLTSNPLTFLAVIALIKAGLIVHYFMHLSNIRQREEGH